MSGLNPASGTTLRRDLAATAKEFDDTLARQGLIAKKVAPLFRVGEPSASYPILSFENFVTEDDTSRQADGTYNFIEGEFASGNYACKENGLASLLDDLKRRTYATFLDFENAMTRILTWRIAMAQERRVAALVLNSSVYTAHNATTTWVTAASATPCADVVTGCDAIAEKTGIPSSMISLICPKADFNYMVRTAEMIDQVKYTYGANSGIRPHQLKAEQVAAILGIKEVLVPQLSYNTKPEGETASMSAIWTAGKAMLAVLADGEEYPIEMPAAWRTMLFAADSPVDPVVERYYSDDRRGQVVRCRHTTDEVATAQANLVTYLLDTRAAS